MSNFPEYYYIIYLKQSNTLLLLFLSLGSPNKMNSKWRPHELPSPAVLCLKSAGHKFICQRDTQQEDEESVVRHVSDTTNTSVRESTYHALVYRLAPTDKLLEGAPSSATQQ